MSPPHIMPLVIRHWALCAVTGLLAQIFQPMASAQGHSQAAQEGRSQPPAREPVLAPSGREPPSRELLEFLLEYGDIDEASFELIVFHGKRDSELADEQTHTGSAAGAPEHNLPHSKELVDEH